MLDVRRSIRSYTKPIGQQAKHIGKHIAMLETMSDLGGVGSQSFESVNRLKEYAQI